jgi:2',3'-cyclic-nucleotide 2'-phosphodiesterase/3'-nucleotidase
LRAALRVFAGLLAILAAGARMPEQSASAPAPLAKKVTITLLSTTDVHRHIEPWDYYADKPANLGLAKTQRS